MPTEGNAGDRGELRKREIPNLKTKKGDGPQPQLSVIRSSFNDLVVYNDEGQPYLDINRLVYKPKKQKHEKEKEKITWYLPDYFFIVSNFLTLIFAAYFFLNGITLISWRNSNAEKVIFGMKGSMQVFNIRTCSPETQASDEICQLIIRHYGDNSMSPFTILRFAGFNDPSRYGLAVLVLGLLNVLNVILGIDACLRGNIHLLSVHMGIDYIFLVLEVILFSLLHFTGRCDEADIDIIRAFLQRFVKNYGLNEISETIKQDTTHLDTIQASISCCGVANWTDYLPISQWGANGELENRSVLTRQGLDKTELIIPSTCCQQWWVRNLYCAHGAHLWAYPTTTNLQAHQFRERISQWGCLPKLISLCENMHSMIGIGGFVACGLHLALSIVRLVCAGIQIHNITILIRERKRIFQDKEHEIEDHAEEGIDEDLFPSISSLLDSFTDTEAVSVAAGNSQFRRNPYGTISRRQLLKNLPSTNKGKQIEQWMATSKAFVKGKPIPEQPKKKAKEQQKRKELDRLEEKFNLLKDNQ